jgi:hypothetical protein
MNKPELFKHYHGEFKEMARQLKSLDWFTDKWTVSVGLNDRDQPYLTLRKSNWSNGIHFESWITGADLERSTIPVAFHFEASFEKTGVQRGKFYAYVLEHGDKIIAQLKGYALSPKSFQLLVNRARFKEGELHEVMKREYNQLHPLGSIIDDAIEAVKK